MSNRETFSSDAPTPEQPLRAARRAHEAAATLIDSLGHPGTVGDPHSATEGHAVNTPSRRDHTRRQATTCPVGGCPHALFWHDVDEIDWPCIERCQAPECRCAGLVAPVGTP